MRSNPLSLALPSCLSLPPCIRDATPPQPETTEHGAEIEVLDRVLVVDR